MLGKKTLRLRAGTAEKMLLDARNGVSTAGVGLVGGPLQFHYPVCYHVTNPADDHLGSPGCAMRVDLLNEYLT